VTFIVAKEENVMTTNKTLVLAYISAWTERFTRNMSKNSIWVIFIWYNGILASIFSIWRSYWY